MSTGAPPNKPSAPSASPIGEKWWRHASRGDRFFQDLVARIGADWVAWLSRILDVPDEDKAALAVLMMGAVDGQVVLFPTDLGKGDAAIRALVGMLEER